MSSSIHVGNGSNITIRARVAQEETRIKEIEANLGLAGGPPFTLDASLKATLDHSLDVTGFARIAPQEALEFGLSKGSRKPIFVSVTTADEPEPRIVCFNYNPPSKKSVIITTAGTVSLSAKRKLTRDISLRPSKEAVPAKSSKTGTKEASTSIRRAAEGSNISLEKISVIDSEEISSTAGESENNSYSSSTNVGLVWKYTGGSYSPLKAAQNVTTGVVDKFTTKQLSVEGDSADGSKYEFLKEQKLEEWVTDDGIVYHSTDAKKIYLQDDVDEAAKKLRQLEMGK